MACGGGGGSSSSSSSSSSNNNGNNGNSGTNGSGPTGVGTNGGTLTAGGNTIATQGVANVAPLYVDAGPALCLPYNTPCSDNNQAFTTILVCPPNTSPTNANCVTIDHVFVDTGSSGLRIPSQVLSTNQLNSLPNVKISGSPLAECIQYAGLTFNWGSVRTADVYMGGSNNQGEVAKAIPIQVLADSSVPSGKNIPSECSSSTGASGSQSYSEMDRVFDLGANALLGVGAYVSDCDFPGTLAQGAYGTGNACSSSSTMPTASVIYFTCPSPTTSCSKTAPSVPYAQQVSNPVASFVKDNNGVIIELPQVAVGGTLGVSSGQGSLVFGIGTQTNNALANGATVLAIDTNTNNDDWAGFYTDFYGTQYPNAAENTTLSNAGGYTIGNYIDSGSSLTFFLDQPTLQTISAASNIVDCTGILDLFYCTSSGSGAYLTQALSATNVDVNGNSRGVSFNVSSASQLFNTANTAFSDLAGPNTSGSSLSSVEEAADGLFDWGLSFFYGRNVYTAILGVTPPSGVQAGPWWAY